MLTMEHVCLGFPLRARRVVMTGDADASEVAAAFGRCGYPGRDRVAGRALNVTSRPTSSIAVHCVRDGHATLSSGTRRVDAPPGSRLGSTVTETGVPGRAGLNVASSPSPVTPVHCVRDGHATPLSPPLFSIVTRAGLPGDAGLNVTSALPPTAVHWVRDGHAMPEKPPLSPLIVTSAGVPGAVGSNVTSLPSRPTAVHCVLDGHATPIKFGAAGSSSAQLERLGEVGLNVTSLPRRSTAVHCVLEGHATPLNSKAAGNS
jgi:hypothetical protein